MDLQCSLIWSFQTAVISVWKTIGFSCYKLLISIDSLTCCVENPPLFSEKSGLDSNLFTHLYPSLASCENKNLETSRDSPLLSSAWKEL